MELHTKCVATVHPVHIEMKQRAGGGGGGGGGGEREKMLIRCEQLSSRVQIKFITILFCIQITHERVITIPGYRTKKSTVACLCFH